MSFWKNSGNEIMRLQLKAQVDWITKTYLQKPEYFSSQFLQYNYIFRRKTMGSFDAWKAFLWYWFQNKNTQLIRNVNHMEPLLNVEFKNGPTIHIFQQQKSMSSMYGHEKLWQRFFPTNKLSTCMMENSTISVGFMNHSANNSTNTKVEVTNSQWAMLTLIIVIVCTALGNLLVCLAVCLDRRLQNMTNYFLMSLALADFLVSILVMPFGMIVELYGKWLVYFIFYCILFCQWKPVRIALSNTFELFMSPGCVFAYDLVMQQ